MNITPELIAGVIVGILSVARTARLIGFDEYPPMERLRAKWDGHWEKRYGIGNGDEGWGKLLHCPFCSAPYLAAGMALWAALTFQYGGDLAQSIWWAANGIWGLSYVSSILVAYDQPE